MKQIEKKDLWLFAVQVAVWAVVLFVMPLATYLSTQDTHATRTSFYVTWGLFQAPLVVYFANFYLLGPYLFFKRRYWLFVLINLVLILGLNSQFFLVYYHRNTIPNMPAMDANMWIGFFSGFLMFLVLNCVIVAVAIGIRHFIRTRQIRQQLKEEKAKNTEAELAWLKNQINPHFLFTTLNNISSLMRNYISLMKLRCNEKTEVKTTFDIQQDVEIAPLLFISLIENAFKHGVSSNRSSMIDIHLEQKGNNIVFTCDNTNYPKDDGDRSGSGIGIENTKRRLELIYHDRYTWEQSISTDNIYSVLITIRI